MKLPTTGKEFSAFIRSHRLTQKEFAEYCGKEGDKALFWARTQQQRDKITRHAYCVMAMGYYRFRMAQLKELRIPPEHAVEIKAQMLDDIMAGFKRTL